jgi:hypothetical protein
MDRFLAEKDRLPPERRDMILNNFPKFLADMEMELGNDASPVWDPSYVHRPPNQQESIKGIYYIIIEPINLSTNSCEETLEENVSLPSTEATFHRLTTSGIVRSNSKDAEK